MLKHTKGEILIKVFLKMKKLKINKNCFKLKVLKLLKYKKGEILIKVFLKMKNIKTQKKGKY